MQRYYHLPLSDVGTRRLSWRRLGVLLRQLPRESATVQASASSAMPPRARATTTQDVASLTWSPEMHLLARVAEELAVANWQRSGGKGTRPKPIPRPGDVPDVDERHVGTSHSIEEMRSILDNW